MTPTPNPRLLHTLLLTSLCAAGALALVACGDSGSSSSGSGGGDAAVGEACTSSADCASNLLCIGAVCVENTSNASNTTGADAGVDTGGGDMDTGVATDTGGGGDMDTGGGGMDTGGGGMDTGGGNTELTGGVSIFEAKVTAGILFTLNRGNAGAAFVEPGGDPPPIQTIGACDVINVSTNPANQFGYDAGAISITGTSRDVTLTANSGGGGSITYTSNLSEDNQDIYNPNSALTISAAGGADVPAFNGSITTPGEHEMTSPAADSTVSGDTTIAWSPAQSGLDVLVSIVPLDALFSPVNGPGLNCAVPSDSGSFTIPAAAMDALQGPRLAITVIKVVNQTIQAGGNDIVLNVTYAHGNVVTLN